MADAPQDAAVKGGIFGRMILFVRQVVAEMKKVSYPTRQELGIYFSVVLVFVLLIMAFVGLIDLGFGWVSQIAFK
ncbi:MAG: preprotein translocase subunit SecE [Actinomycetaceae bacterium]|nr:preprotein translocase subunit SecE [Actinomycetaceae bacterium]